MKTFLFIPLITAALAFTSCDRPTQATNSNADTTPSGVKTTTGSSSNSGGMATTPATTPVTIPPLTSEAATAKATTGDATNTSMGLKFKGTWNDIKGKLKQQYANLTDDDLLYVEGKEDELVGRLQTKLGKSKAEVETMLRNY